MVFIITPLLMALLLPWLDPCISLDSLPDSCPIHNTTFTAQIHLSHCFLDLSSHTSPFLFSHHPLHYPFPSPLSFSPLSLLFYPPLHSPPLLQSCFVLSFPFCLFSHSYHLTSMYLSTPSLLLIPPVLPFFLLLLFLSSDCCAISHWTRCQM